MFLTKDNKVNHKDIDCPGNSKSYSKQNIYAIKLVQSFKFDNIYRVPRGFLFGKLSELEVIQPPLHFDQNTWASFGLYGGIQDLIFEYFFWEYL